MHRYAGRVTSSDAVFRTNELRDYLGEKQRENSKDAAKDL